jgi:hypothetical protein
MATKRRMPWELRRFWPAGEYTLLADSHTAEDGLTYLKGTLISLGEREATRLGNAGDIGPPDSMYAVRARVEGGLGTVRDEYLCEIWELTGAWQERGRT